MSFNLAALPETDHLARTIRAISNDHNSTAVERIDDVLQVIDHYATRNSLSSQQTRQLRSHFLAQYCSNNTPAAVTPPHAPHIAQIPSFTPMQGPMYGYSTPYLQPHGFSIPMVPMAGAWPTSPTPPMPSPCNPMTNHVSQNNMAGPTTANTPEANVAGMNVPNPAAAEPHTDAPIQEANGIAEPTHPNREGADDASEDEDDGGGAAAIPPRSLRRRSMHGTRYIPFLNLSVHANTMQAAKDQLFERLFCRNGNPLQQVPNSQEGTIKIFECSCTVHGYPMRVRLRNTREVINPFRSNAENVYVVEIPRRNKRDSERHFCRIN